MNSRFDGNDRLTLVEMTILTTILMTTTQITMNLLTVPAHGRRSNECHDNDYG